MYVKLHLNKGILNSPTYRSRPAPTCNEGVVGLEASGTGFGSADKCDEHLVCAAHEPWWNLTAAVDADDAVLPEMLLHCTHCHRIYIVATTT